MKKSITRPRGKTVKMEHGEDGATTSAALFSSADERDSLPGVLSKKKGVKGAKNAVARQKDSHIKGVLHSSQESNSDSEEQEVLGQRTSLNVQGQILEELKKMSTRLNAVEQQEAVGASKGDSKRTKRQKISSVVKHKKCSAKAESTDSLLSENSNSEDELQLPKLSYIRSSKQIQRQIDESLAKLGKNQLKVMTICKN